jgi:hypothetical protein
MLRFGFFLLGIVLFYAPFALGTKLFLQLIDKPHLGDAHSICLRMPIQWLAQPWMYGTLFSNPTYLFTVLFPSCHWFFRPCSVAGCAPPDK